MAHEIKRVPDGFDWPLGVVWFGYLLDPVPCRLCKRDGTSCALCDGEGDIAPRVEVPAGHAYQLWEIVSEGSPVSPAFSSEAELAMWLSRNGPATWRARFTSPEDWLQAIRAMWNPVSSARLTK